MLEQLVTVFVTFLVVIDPIGVAPMFSALTRGGSDHYRRRMALKGTLIATLICLFFVFTGDALLRFLGISLAAFRVSGGILLFLLILYLPAGAGLSASAQAGAACFALALVWWVTEPFPTYLTSLVLMFLLLITRTSEPKAIMDVLGMEVIWLNLLAFILSAMLVKTRLARRLSLWLVLRLGKNAGQALLAFLLLPLAATANTLYKCTDESGLVLFTNQKTKNKNCVVLSQQAPAPTTGGNGTKARASATPTPGDFPRVSGTEQKARDSDRRAILDKELANELQNADKAKKALFLRHC
jgi:multiple antibiotic resistance protein